MTFGTFTAVCHHQHFIFIKDDSGGGMGAGGEGVEGGACPQGDTGQAPVSWGPRGPKRWAEQTRWDLVLRKRQRGFLTDSGQREARGRPWERSVNSANCETSSSRRDSGRVAIRDGPEQGSRRSRGLPRCSDASRLGGLLWGGRGLGAGSPRPRPCPVLPEDASQGAGLAHARGQGEPGGRVRARGVHGNRQAWARHPRRPTPK